MGRGGSIKRVELFFVLALAFVFVAFAWTAPASAAEKPIKIGVLLHGPALSRACAHTS